ncbi:MAG: cyclic pyranopterin monophosphate synthase MoaC [bacterium]
MKKLTHIDEQQRPHMVDVSPKAITHRVAVASGWITLQPATVRLIRAHALTKGNVLITAELAGIQAAKQTAHLIPLCHIVPLTHVAVKATLRRNGVEIKSAINCTDRTGVEMEALTAVSVALLTIYDMCKAVDKKMTLTDIHLVSKTK